MDKPTIYSKILKFLDSYGTAYVIYLIIWAIMYWIIQTLSGNPASWAQLWDSRIVAIPWAAVASFGTVRSYRFLTRRL